MNMKVWYIYNENQNNYNDHNHDCNEKNGSEK